MTIHPARNLLPLPPLESIAAAAAPAVRVNATPNPPRDVHTDASASVLAGIAAADLAKLNAVLGRLEVSEAGQFHPLDRVTALARIEADMSLTRASHFLESAGVRALPNWQTRPDVLLATAQTLFDTGGYANYVCSAYLAQAIADQLIRTPNAVPLEAASQRALRRNAENAWASMRKRARSVTAVLWVRTPLLLLLLIWLAFGLIAGPIAIVLRDLSPQNPLLSWLDAFYSFWGIGFLALVGFGFWARLRNVRF